jgi:hypothetical protein
MCTSISTRRRIDGTDSWHVVAVDVRATMAVGTIEVGHAAYPSDADNIDVVCQRVCVSEWCRLCE